MLDCIYDMTLNYFDIVFSALKRYDFVMYIQRYYGRQYVIVLPKSVKHLWFINFIAWRSTPRRDVMG